MFFVYGSPLFVITATIIYLILTRTKSSFITYVTTYKPPQENSNGKWLGIPDKYWGVVFVFLIVLFYVVAMTITTYYKYGIFKITI